MRNPNRLPGVELRIFEGDVQLHDNFSLFFGDNKDAGIKYDGTDLILSPALVGSGKVKLPADAHLVLPQHNDAATPTLAFGDGDTGLYESTDDNLYLAFAGVAQYLLSGTTIRSITNYGAMLKRTGSTSIDPVHTFQADDNTGIGRAGLDVLSLIAGGVEGQRITEITGNIDHIITGIVKTPTTQTLTGAGAVDILSALTLLVTTAADALTLANGAEGQAKFIVMKTYGGIGTLTPTALKNGTTLTFDAVGDSASLIFMDGAWVFMGGTATLG